MGDSEAAEAGPPSPDGRDEPVPAIVVIVPAAETLRIRLFSASLMTKPPSGVGSTSVGEFSEAAVAGPPSPENADLPLPATVVIVPFAATLRMRSLS